MNALCTLWAVSCPGVRRCLDWLAPCWGMDVCILWYSNMSTYSVFEMIEIAMRVSMTSSMCKTREITGTVLEAQRKGLRLRNYLLKGAIGSPEAMRLKIDTALQIQNIGERWESRSLEQEAEDLDKEQQREDKVQVLHIYQVNISIKWSSTERMIQRKNHRECV